MAFNAQYFRSMPPVTKNLIMVNLFIFAVMMFMPQTTEQMVYKYLGAHYFSSPLFNPAQLFTYMFIHGGLGHVFFNMLALFFFGPQIEWSLGSKRFLFYYISCGIGAALVQEGVYAIAIHKYATMFSPEAFQEIITRGANFLYSDNYFADPTANSLNYLVNGPVVGASGAIYGVLLAFGMLYPNAVVYLMIPPMPVKAKYLVIGYAALELFYGATGTNDQIAHFAHLGGMLFGLLIILYWKKHGTFTGQRF